ncbi:MAG: hypothetical protein PHY92_04095 [Alphaproteobacteria bacterium]|nr:hypothetical protein [Alphaproteobacteria bacterium]
MKKVLFTSAAALVVILALAGTSTANGTGDYEPKTNKTTARHKHTGKMRSVAAMPDCDRAAPSVGSMHPGEGEQKLVVLLPKGYFQPGDVPLFVVAHPTHETDVP